MKSFKEFIEQVVAGKTVFPVDLRSTSQKQKEINIVAKNIKKQGIEKISPDY